MVIYVVWSPQLGAQERQVAAAAGLIPDRRVQDYWDSGEVVGRAFEPVLGLPIPAWDTWMVFDQAATWRGAAPPVPSWWEHQLSVGPPERHLDPARFAAHAEGLESGKR